MPNDQPTVGDDFEREPVPQKALLGLTSFVGQYAGEHTAGTELMIGPLFVAAGVSAADLILGLLLGNLLAVLSWTFFTAPIATRARLTLYFQLEKICGRSLVTIYNVANGAMFCILAGSMITVAATAVGVGVNFPMPSLDDKLPNSIEWVIVVFCAGLLVSVVAAFGYTLVARVANVAAPWMTVVFIAFGIVALRQFIDVTGREIHSLSDFWQLANDAIWRGGEPLPGRVKFTFWHVMFFAWFCNVAMHMGMSDLSVFRFARRTWYGLSTASGMYLGHFLAWIAASIMYALQLHIDPTNTKVLPGPMSYQACGFAGVLCVIMACWTTANPTIYRAGLAFQAIMPRLSRFKVTVATGILATIAGMFPAVAMNLLDFVALYGLLLMPMGAIVFVDFWLMPKFGLQPNFAERTGRSFNWAAGLTWLLTLVGCAFLVNYASIRDSLIARGIQILPGGFNGIEIWFVSLPGWLAAAVMYILLSIWVQRGVRT